MTTETLTMAGHPAHAGASRPGAAPCTSYARRTRVMAGPSVRPAAPQHPTGRHDGTWIVGSAVKPVTCWGFGLDDPLPRRPEDRSP